VAGRRLDDDVQVRLRWPGGVRGQLWASQVAIGASNALRLRIIGSDAALDWSQESPDLLGFTRLGEAPRVLRRGGPGLSPAAAQATRLPAGHPEGYLEGFAQIYADAADLVAARRAGQTPPLHLSGLPGLADGVDGLRFITAAVRSAAADGAWVPLKEVCE
jgi:predicted dehydrogenase